MTPMVDNDDKVNSCNENQSISEYLAQWNLEKAEIHRLKDL